jgi:adenosine deaminase
VTGALDLSAEDRRRLAENSFRASFLPDAVKQRHLAAVAAAAGA